MVFDRTLKCTVTGKVYYIKGEMNCESTNIIYLIKCMKCLEQYVGCAIKFKSRFRIHKSNIKTRKNGCGTAWLLGTLIINNTVIPPIRLYIYVSSSSRNHIVSMIIVILKIFDGIE